VADGVVGGSVVVLRSGRVLARHAYGRGDLRAAGAPAEDAVYHWASITKTLTAIAILQLRDRGRLTLDDPIVRYVPELRQVHDGFGPIDDVTLRMLLSHSAGFQNPTWPYKAGKSWEPFEPTRWEQLVSMMPYQEVQFRPGSQYSYSNPAFIYLARIIEQLTGDPYEVYVQKNIWTPLGMNQSYFGTTPYHLSRWRSNNYTLRGDSSGAVTVAANGREFDPGITVPNGGWNAPLGDLVKYVGFLTHATRGDTAAARLFDTVLKPSTVEEMWRPIMKLPPPAAPGSAVGLSFFLSPEGLVEHSGYQAGFRSFIVLNPRTSKALIYVLNTDNEVNPDQSEAGLLALDRAARAVLKR